MLLAIDIGNTQTKLGLFEDNELMASWRISTDKQYAVDDLEIKIHELFRLKEIEVESVEAVALASVVPPLTGHWLALSKKCFDQKALSIGHKHCAALAIQYDYPEELGADRIADAVAAKVLYGYPAIIIDFGTATNIEVIDVRGVFLGGIIMPGLEASANALFSHASKLSSVEFRVPKTVIGTNTFAAVQSGLVLGEIARIEGLTRMIWDNLGYETQVIATGGLSQFLTPLSSMISNFDINLTLWGIKIIHEAEKEEA
jgi:type III pantothenate kinase